MINWIEWYDLNDDESGNHYQYNDYDDDGDGGSEAGRELRSKSQE